MKRLPQRYAPIIFGLILSGLMSLVVSCVTTANTVGLGSEFVSTWLHSWIISWMVAFPTVLIVKPAVVYIVSRLAEGQIR